MSAIDRALAKAHARKGGKENAAKATEKFTLPFTDQEVTKHLRAMDPEEFDEEMLADIDDLDRGAEQVRRLFPEGHPVEQFLSEVIGFCGTIGAAIREKVDEQ
jgi:hypothetical protein